MSLFRTVELKKISSGNSGSYVKGKWVPGTTVETLFKGTWQPTSGQALELLPEGKRNKETYTCYAPIDISFTTFDPVSNSEGDNIQLDGKLFEVITASKWNNGIINHWELICVRKKEGEK